jgi:transposase InsO family protein
MRFGFSLLFSIRRIMDVKPRWADNIMIERWFRSLKAERISYLQDKSAI